MGLKPRQLFFKILVDAKKDATAFAALVRDGPIQAAIDVGPGVVVVLMIDECNTSRFMHIYYILNPCNLCALFSSNYKC